MIESPEQNVAAIVAAIETMLYGLEDDLALISDRAMLQVAGDINGVMTQMVPVVTRVLEAVDVNLPGEPEGILDWSPVERITNGVDDHVSDVEASIRSIQDRATDHLDNAIAGLDLGIGDLVSGLLSTLGDLVHGLLGDLAIPLDLWHALFEAIQEKVQANPEPVYKWIRESVIFGLTGLIGGSAGPIIRADDLLRGQSDQTGTLHKTAEDMIANWENQPAWSAGLIRFAAMILTAHTQISALNSGYIAKLIQVSHADQLPTPLSSEQLVSLSRTGFITKDWARDEAKRLGLSPQLFDVLYNLSTRFLTPNDYVEMWKRTGDDGELDTLRKLGLGDDDISRLRTMSLAIPTPSDLVRFMVRDVFDDKAIIEGKLDDKFKDKIKPEWNRRVGIDEETMRLFWMAHWSLPSPTMMYEMYHRGFIDETQMIDGLKLADYAPGWIENLVKINYAVPGRIDVRRMWESGVISRREDLVKRHTDMGYSPEDAETLATFVERIAEQKKANEAERLHAPLAKEIVRMYADGANTYDESLSQLVGLGYTDDEARYRLQVGIFERERDRSNKVRTSIHRTYVRGFVDEAGARDRLAHYGFGEQEIAAILDEWSLDRELQEESDEKRHQRDLSKSEVIEAYRDLILSRDDAVRDLSALGYDAQESETLVRLEDARQTRAESKLVESAVRTQYLNRVMDDDSAVNTLSGLGYTATRIAALMARWSVERAAKEPNLSISQIERMILKGTVHIEDIEPELVKRGYDEAERTMLLSLWGTEMADQTAALQERVREFDIREQRLAIGQTTRLSQADRSLDLRETQFDQNQEALQRRFDAAQEQSRDLALKRLDSQTALQSQRIAAQTARDAKTAETRIALQERSITAQDSRLEAQIVAAGKRAQEAIAQRDRALAAHQEAQAQSIAAQDVRQQRGLEAAEKRAREAAAAAEKRAILAQEATANLQAQRIAAANDLTMVRAQIQEVRDIRLNAERIAAESRQEATRVRTENRTAARKALSTAESAANASELQSLQLNRTAAVADIEARFATLQAQLADARRQSALEAQLAAQQLLAENTPTAAFLDSSS